MIKQLESNLSNLKLKLADPELSHEAISRINTTIRETEDEIKIQRQSTQSPTAATGRPDQKAEITANQAGANISTGGNRSDIQ